MVAGSTIELWSWTIINFSWASMISSLCHSKCVLASSRITTIAPLRALRHQVSPRRAGPSAMAAARSWTAARSLSRRDGRLPGSGRCGTSLTMISDWTSWRASPGQRQFLRSQPTSCHLLQGLFLYRFPNRCLCLFPNLPPFVCQAQTQWSVIKGVPALQLEG